MSFTLEKLVATLRPAARLPIGGAAAADACVCGPLWQSTVVYSIGNFANYNGVCYQSIANANLGNEPDIDGGVHWRARGTLSLAPNPGDATGLWINWAASTDGTTDTVAISGGVRPELVGAQIWMGAGPNPADQFSATGTLSAGTHGPYPFSVSGVTGYPPDGDGPGASYFMLFQPPLAAPSNMNTSASFTWTGELAQLQRVSAFVADAASLTPAAALYAGVALPVTGGNLAYVRAGAIFPTLDATYASVSLYLSSVFAPFPYSSNPASDSPFEAVPGGSSVTVNFTVAGHSYGVTLSDTQPIANVALVAPIAVTAASLTPALQWTIASATNPSGSVRLMLKILLRP